MCCSNGLLFHKKSLNMGPIFYKNIPYMGTFFQNFEKSHKFGTFFCQNDP